MTYIRHKIKSVLHEFDLEPQNFLTVVSLHTLNLLHPEMATKNKIRVSNIYCRYWAYNFVICVFPKILPLLNVFVVFFSLENSGLGDDHILLKLPVESFVSLGLRTLQLSYLKHKKYVNLSLFLNIRQ